MKSKIYSSRYMKISSKGMIWIPAFVTIGFLLAFPVTELIIHPRVQTDYYKNKPRMEYFLKALEISKNPVVSQVPFPDYLDVRRLLPSARTSAWSI